MAALKLGSQTGSFINHIMSTSQRLPEVGKGCTKLHWTDRTPYEVLEVSPDYKTVVIAEINAKIIDGNETDGSAVYDYSEISSHHITLKFRYKNWWYEKLNFDGKPELVKFGSVIFGVKDKYYDPCF